MIFATSSDITHNRRPWLADLLFPLILVGTLVVMFYSRTEEPPPQVLPHQPPPNERAGTFDAYFFYLIWLMNALFLLGRAVCSRTGSLVYLALLAAFALLAYALGAICQGSVLWIPACAVNALAGMYLMYWPTHSINGVIIIIVWRRWIEFEVDGYWAILGWVLFDLAFAVLVGWQNAPVVHMAFFLLGLVIAFLFIKCRLTPIDEEDDCTLLQVFSRRQEPDAVWQESWSARRAAEDSAPPLTPASSRGAPRSHTAGPSPNTRPAPAKRKLAILCPCGQVLRIPEDPAITQITCPLCGHTVKRKT